MRTWPVWQSNEPIDWHDDPVEPPPPPSAGRSFKLAFSTVYDYLGAGISASLLAFVIYFTVFSMLYGGLIRLVHPSERAGGIVLAGLVLLVSPVILGPLTAGLFTLARNMFTRDDPHFFDIWRGARRLFLPAWGLAALQTVVTTVLVCDVLWLLTRSALPLKLAGVAVGYVALFWAMMATYHWPLLVAQQPGWKKLLYRSFLVTVANPFYTVALTAASLIFLLGPVVIFFGPKAGPAILFPVSLILGILLPTLQTVATLEIFRKYDSENT